jgi:hypothetical protein
MTATPRPTRTTTPRVLVLGLDPATVPGADAEQILRGLAHGQDRFADHGIAADLGLVPLDETAEDRVVGFLRQARYDCVVIGGGLRRPEALLTLFEATVDLTHRHAPQAAIAFNTSGADSLDAAVRRLPFLADPDREGGAET